MERPRKVNAKKSQKDIAADEYVQPELKLGFESKRDRYNGFDANDYSRVVERYEAADAMKQKIGDDEFTPQEISAYVLQKLKADAEAYLGQEVTQAVITCPAYFSDAQRKAKSTY